MTKEEQKRDRYYLKKYGRDLAWYNSQLKEQKEACGICFKPAKAFSKYLAVDHDHSHRYVKVECAKTHINLGTFWRAKAVYLGRQFWSSACTRKAEAIRIVRRELKIASCRGLLCWRCNTSLQKWKDDPKLMQSAINYLSKHQIGEK